MLNLFDCSTRLRLRLRLRGKRNKKELSQESKEVIGE